MNVECIRVYQSIKEFIRQDVSDRMYQTGCMEQSVSEREYKRVNQTECIGQSVSYRVYHHLSSLKRLKICKYCLNIFTTPIHTGHIWKNHFES